MNRMWEIREGYEPESESRYGRRYGMRSAEDKAYECGFEDGYKKAMEEMEHSSYGERRGSGMRRY